MFKTVSVVDSRRSIFALANESLRIARFKEPGFLLIRTSDVPGIARASSVERNRRWAHRFHARTFANGGLSRVLFPHRVPCRWSISGFRSFAAHFAVEREQKGRRQSLPGPDPHRVLKPIRFFLFFSPDLSFSFDRSFLPDTRVSHPRHARWSVDAHSPRTLTF